MSDGLVITFQSQLSIIMETILKSAMTEITRLVEESFMEEVTRGKQELELLLRRLQFSESKLKERERRVRCSDCGRATSTGERTDEKPTEMLAGEESLCFRLSLREQSEKKPPFNDVWSSTEALDGYVPRGTQTIKDKNVMDTGEMYRKQESTSNNTVPPPPPQCVLQNLLSSAAVTRIHESCSRLKSSESQCKTPVRDLTPSKELDVAQSRLMQSVTGEVQVSELASFPANGSVKSELGPDPDLVAVKEEDEMIPVWDCRDDDADGVTDQNPVGSWNESQLSHRCPDNPAADLVRMCSTSRQRTFSMVAREVLTQFQVWQRACYSRNIEWGPITAKIISALPYLSGMETEVIVRCTKMLHNRRDYLRRRAKDASLERTLQMEPRFLVQLNRGDLIPHAQI